ncbi:MAG: hypothetical protein J6T15_05200 [Bacilli bacterium]|nr:hypothetical protein [Bacilli bacterium]
MSKKYYIDEVGLEKIFQLIKDQLDAKEDTVSTIEDSSIEELFTDPTTPPTVPEQQS